MTLEQLWCARLTASSRIEPEPSTKTRAVVEALRPEVDEQTLSSRYREALRAL